MTQSERNSHSKNRSGKNLIYNYVLIENDLKAAFFHMICRVVFQMSTNATARSSCYVCAFNALKKCSTFHPNSLFSIEQGIPICSDIS